MARAGFLRGPVLADPMLRSLAVGAVLLALLGSYQAVRLVRGGAGGTVPAAAPAGPVPGLPGAGPNPGQECRVRTGAGDRTLAAAQAKAVTTLAAVARRREAGAGAVARVLDVLLAEQKPVALTPARAAALLARPGPGSASAAATALAQALDGSRPGALTCAYWRRSELPEQPMGRTGLTPRAAALKTGYERVFDELPAGGFEPGGVRGGHVDNSAHYDGRAIDVFFRPMTAQNRRDGWVFAHWLVAHGDAYDLLSVIFDDRIWTVWASFGGWRPYVHPSGNTTNPVLRHLEHVHAAVVRGGRPGPVLGR